MKKTFALACLALLTAGTAVAAPLAETVVTYEFRVRLDTAKKTVAGTETLTWLNATAAPVSELRFHLYLNAFKNNRTTMMKESGAAFRKLHAKDEDWGYITVHKIEVVDGPDLTPGLAYIQPDDGNPDDWTVMKVDLPYPVNPGERIRLSLDFTSKLPKVTRRSGFSGDFFMAAQWFPKIGVLEEAGWNCHQYHANSEFFADFGEFKAEITVPEGHIVGATGRRLSERTNGDGTKTYVHEQADVHDFAWTACPDFVEFRERFVLDEPGVDTEMIFLIHRAHLGLKDRHVEALRRALEFYSRNYGPYPYETVTLVDPPPGGGGAGGMEYPTLFTTMSMSWVPKGFRLPELVTIHEFGHGYWYGIVGSNEFEEAWLDEGINTYSEIKAMNLYYGEDASIVDLAGLKISDLDFARLSVIASGRFDPIVKKSWEYVSGGSYGTNVYQKAGLMLLTLERLLGEEVMGRIMRAYYERWKFRHPTTADFVALVQEVSGRDLAWYFDQVLYTPDKLDYAVSEVRVRESAEPQGLIGDALRPEPEKPAGRGDSEAKSYRNEVVAVRRGEWIMPQDILVTFENGKTARETWDGRDRWKRFVYVRDTKALSAVIDPDRRLLLDVNFTNNSKTLKPGRPGVLKATLSFLSWLQGVLSFAAI